MMKNHQALPILVDISISFCKEMIAPIIEIA